MKKHAPRHIEEDILEFTESEKRLVREACESSLTQSERLISVIRKRRALESKGDHSTSD